MFCRQVFARMLALKKSKKNPERLANKLALLPTEEVKCRGNKGVYRVVITTCCVELKYV